MRIHDRPQSAHLFPVFLHVLTMRWISLRGLQGGGGGRWNSRRTSRCRGGRGGRRSPRQWPWCPARSHVRGAAASTTATPDVRARLPPTKLLRAKKIQSSSFPIWFDTTCVLPSPLTTSLWIFLNCLRSFRISCSNGWKCFVSLQLAGKKELLLWVSWLNLTFCVSWLNHLFYVWICAEILYFDTTTLTKHRNGINNHPPLEPSKWSNQPFHPQFPSKPIPFTFTLTVLESNTTLVLY